MIERRYSHIYGYRTEAGETVWVWEDPSTPFALIDTRYVTRHGDGSAEHKLGPFRLRILDHDFMRRAYIVALEDAKLAILKYRLERRVEIWYFGLLKVAWKLGFLDCPEGCAATWKQLRPLPLYGRRKNAH